ncbi:MAG: acyltransferase [Microbacterium sp.]
MTNQLPDSELRLPSETKTTFGLPRIGALTGVRWWAAFAVLLAHNVPGGSTPAIVQSFFEQGVYGVTVFFVLSGFILTVTYREGLSAPTPAKVWNFYVARFARVYPLYLLVLLWVTPKKMTTIGAIFDETWLAHLFTIQAWFGVPFAFLWNGPGWTIGVEIFFYALFPLIVFLARKPLQTLRGSIGVTVAAAVVLIAEALLAEPTGWAMTAATTVFPPLRLGDFVLGIGLAGIYMNARRDPRLERIGVWFIVTFLAVAAGFVVMRTFYFATPGLNILYALPAGLLILGLAWTPDFWGTRWLATRPMIVLGEASYAFYLIHMSAGAYLNVGLLSEGFGKASTLLFVTGVVFVTAMAIGLNIMIESPARRAIRRWISVRKRTPKVEAAASTPGAASGAEPMGSDAEPGSSRAGTAAPHAAAAAPEPEAVTPGAEPAGSGAGVPQHRDV